ncbi:hypothetical protein SASPL_119648 [Salvia splendens]|uniref:Uncharacterized protein n=1 Tax=Salvia splendens TaxID=180675 RepID=A0A8X8XT23_SALSN|nr:hypothetical protein SASPL_119648 [Salvia splendens]
MYRFNRLLIGSFLQSLKLDQHLGFPIAGEKRKQWGTPTSGTLTLRTTVLDPALVLSCGIASSLRSVLDTFDPCVRKSSWYNQKVWANVLQTVLPQQCKGNWLHQVPLNLDKGCATISEST